MWGLLVILISASAAPSISDDTTCLSEELSRLGNALGLDATNLVLHFFHDLYMRLFCLDSN